MTERMDMSLDDIISTNKTSHRGRGRGRGSRGGNRGRRNFRDNNNSDKMELGSGYNKTEEGTGGAFRRQRIGKKANKPYAKKEENGTNDEDMKGDEDTWKHDLFEQQEEGKDPNVEFPRGNNLSLETGTKIRVENLEYTVSESDLQELFGSVGTVKKAKVHYDRSGRSKGSADIIFTTKNDAESAVSKYNGVTLDGKAMKITLLGSALAAKLGTFTVSTSRGGQRRVLSNRSVIRGGRGGRGRGNNRR